MRDTDLPEDSPEAFSKPLLSWFHAAQRAMPWRETRDPYYIWVSEVMLQQTQVATVVPYYERFMARFPTVRSLAEAPVDQVLKHWEGLGYYSRARNLQKAAQTIVAEHGGVFPRDYTAIRALPGIGDYTAGAVASIAFNQPRPAVDGNVLRVFSRWFRLSQDVTRPQTRKAVEDLATRMIPEGHAWQFNQALMELGALVCAPRRPRCEACPVEAVCRARIHGDPEAFPVKTPKRPPRPVRFAVAVLSRESSVWITRRPAKGLLGGLWEFPAVPLEDGQDVAAVLEQALSLPRLDWTPFGTVEHTYTHLKATMHVIRAEAQIDLPLRDDDDCRWVELSSLNDFAFSNANQKIIRRLTAGDPIDELPLFRGARR